MKCKKCGAEIEKGDVFCGSCGEKIDIDNIVEDDNIYDCVEVVDNEENKSKKKTKIIVAVAIAAAVIIAIVAFFALQPKEIDIEAGKLGEILLSEDEAAIKEYEGATLHVHGYLNREREEEYYLLYTNIKDENVVMFTSKEPIAEDVGDESELVVTGKIAPMSEESSLWVLEAEAIDVKKKVERIYNVESVGELLTESDKYLNKKVMVPAVVMVAGSTDVVMADVEPKDENEHVSLLGLSDTKIAKIGFNYGMYLVTGTFCLKNKKPSIDVEKIKLVTELDEPQTEEDDSDDDITPLGNVDRLIYYAEDYSGKMVTAAGILDGTGETFWLWNDDQTDYVFLEGNDLEAAVSNVSDWMYCHIEGRLEVRDNGEIVVDVENIW